VSLAIFWANFKMSRGVVLAWGGSLLLMGLFVAIMYDSIKEMAGFEEYIKAMPEQMMSAFGIRDEADVQALLHEGGLTLEGFISLEFLSSWPMIMAIYAIFAVGGIIAGEVEKGTADLLLSQPIQRHQMLVSKFIVFLVNLAAIAVASFDGILIGLAIVGQLLEPTGIALTLLQGWLLVAGIAGYSALFSCLLLDPRRVRIASGLLTVALYIVSFVGPSLGPLRWLEQISPFFHYNATDTMVSYTMDGTGVALSLGLALASFTAALIVLRRRDIVSGNYPLVPSIA